MTGFLGPNGAGKTTTMRALMGLLRPTGGEALVEGARRRRCGEPLRTIGAALEATSFHPSRSGRNHLRTLAATAAIPNSRVDEVLEMVELTPSAKRRRLRLLARHAPAAGAGGGAARRAADPDPRRAGQRARPAGRALAARSAPGPGGRGPHGAGLQPPPGRGRADRRPPDRDPQGPAGRRDLARRVHRDGGRVAAGQGHRHRWPRSRLRERGASVEADADADDALRVEGISAEEIGAIALESGIALHELAPVRSSLEERFLEVTGEEGLE